MAPIELQGIIAVIGIVGAGFSAYIGVKVALARIEGKVEMNSKQLDDHEGRINRLEKPYFDH